VIVVFTNIDSADINFYLSTLQISTSIIALQHEHFDTISTTVVLTGLSSQLPGNFIGDHITLGRGGSLLALLLLLLLNHQQLSLSLEVYVIVAPLN